MVLVLRSWIQKNGMQSLTKLHYKQFFLLKNCLPAVLSPVGGPNDSSLQKCSKYIFSLMVCILQSHFNIRVLTYEKIKIQAVWASFFLDIAVTLGIQAYESYARIILDGYHMSKYARHPFREQPRLVFNLESTWKRFFNGWLKVIGNVR